MTNREYYAVLLDKLNDYGLPLTPNESEWYDYYTRTRQFMSSTEREEFDRTELDDNEDWY